MPHYRVFPPVAPRGLRPSRNGSDTAVEREAEDEPKQAYVFPESGRSTIKIDQRRGRLALAYVRKLRAASATAVRASTSVLRPCTTRCHLGGRLVAVQQSRLSHQ